MRGDCSMRAKFQNGCLAFRRCLWGSDKVIINSPISIYSTFYKFCIFAFQLKKNPRENVNYLTCYSRLFNHYLEYQTNLRKSKTFCSKGFQTSFCQFVMQLPRRVKISQFGPRTFCRKFWLKGKGAHQGSWERLVGSVLKKLSNFRVVFSLFIASSDLMLFTYRGFCHELVYRWPSCTLELL